jgi:geranylgeranyl pyrophosphate synthase
MCFPSTRITKEIVEDLPTVYEMPTEAVAWVDRMIQYNVAGGKMNRGLTVMAVQQTFAQANGQTLTAKVCLIFELYVCACSCAKS